MVSNVTIAYVVTRVARSAGLTTSELTRFNTWVTKWKPDWMTKPEYTERTITTMARNAALAITKGEL